MDFNDMPRKEILELADKIVRDSDGKSSVHFKFTCKHCDARCTFEQPNVLFEYGECDACGKRTRVEKAGFMLVMSFVEPPPSKALFGRN